MPRISLPAPETMTPDQRKVYDKIVTGKRGRIQGPLRAALHNPDLAERWSALGELLRYGTTLTPRQSELAILITGRLCRSPFEWYAHRPEAEKAGLPADVIDAIFAGATPPVDVRRRLRCVSLRAGAQSIPIGLRRRLTRGRSSFSASVPSSSSRRWSGTTPWWP